MRDRTNAEAKTETPQDQEQNLWSQTSLRSQKYLKTTVQDHADMQDQDQTFVVSYRYFSKTKVSDRNTSGTDCWLLVYVCWYPDPITTEYLSEGWTELTTHARLTVTVENV